MNRTIRRATMFAAAGCALACGKPESKPDTAKAAVPATAATSGEVAIVVVKPLDALQHVQGELTPYEAVDLYARVNGYLKDVLVDRGAEVHRGDVIAVLDAPELLQQRAEAEAKLAASRQTADRLRTASRTQGAVAANDVENADAAARADQARVDALRALESYLTVRAPFDGVVTERRAHPGALVGPGQASGMLVHLEDHARLRLTAAVPEQLTGTVRTGADVGFSVSAWPGTTFHGKIARIAGAVDPRTRTMPVELEVTAGGKLAPGMFADVAWPARRDAPSTFVPASAIVQTTGRTYVIRVKAGAAQLIDVRRGVATGALAEVFGALAAGDSVLARGVEDVSDGDHITVVTPKKP